MERHRTAPLGPRHSRGEFSHWPATDWKNPRFLRQAEGAFFANPHICLTSRGCVIRGDRMIELSNELLKSAHLEDKRQLGLLTEPVVSPGYVPKYFNHTRAEHVNTAAIIMDLQAIMVGASLRDRYALRLAANHHDYFTSPAGDALKLVDPDLFNEERDPKQLKSKDGWWILRDRYHFHEKLFWDTLIGQGSPSELNDLADKAGYLILDTEAYTRHCESLPPEFRPAGYFAVRDLLRDHPQACDIYKWVEVVNGRVVITDADSFAAFLRLGGLMFNLLYYKPEARVEEHFVGSLVIPYFYRRKEITHSELFPMSDAELQKKIGELLDIRNWRSILWKKFQPEVYAFATMEEAQRERNALLIREPDRTILLEEWKSKSSPGTQYLVRYRGEIVPFRVAKPKEAEEIEALKRVGKPFRLYSFKIDFNRYPRLKPIVEAYNHKMD